MIKEQGNEHVKQSSKSRMGRDFNEMVFSVKIENLERQPPGEGREEVRRQFPQKG